MKLQRQGHRECWITSLAMVTGQTLQAVKAEFEECAGGGIPYIALMEIPDKWFLTTVILMDKYKLSVSQGSHLNKAMGLPSGTGRVNLTAKQLWGKGILGVSMGKKTHHAVAFEDGMIYDPEMITPMSLITWRKIKRQITGWRIDRRA